MYPRRRFQAQSRDAVKVCARAQCCSTNTPRHSPRMRYLGRCAAPRVPFSPACSVAVPEVFFWLFGRHRDRFGPCRPSLLAA